MGGPGTPGPEGRRTREVEGGFGAVEVLPQVHRDVRPAPIREGDDPPGGPFGRDLPGRPLDAFVRTFDRPALLGGPDDARGDDPGLATPDLPRALGPGVGPFARVRLGQCGQQATAGRLLPLESGQADAEPGIGARQPLFVRGGVGGDETRAATHLDFRDEDAKAGLHRPRIARLGAAQGPGGLLGEGIRPLHEGQAVRVRGAGSQAAPQVGVQPGGVDHERVGAPALGQLATERAHLGPQPFPFEVEPLPRVDLGEPDREPLRVDGGQRPQPQAMQEARACQALGLGVPRLACQPADRLAHGHRVSPESLQGLARTPRRIRPPGPPGDEFQGGQFTVGSGLGPAPSRGRRRVRPPPSTRRTRRRPSDRARLPTRRARASPWPGARGVRPAARWRGG